MTEICAVIFDMDGLLIDTEPIWRLSEIKVFGEVGLVVTQEDCMQTMGVRIAEIVDMWYRRHPWSGPTTDEVTDRIYDQVIEYVRTEGRPMPGVLDALELVRARGLACAIASSSSERLIRAVVDRLGIAGYIDAVCSADNELEGKPHPGVYLSAAQSLGVEASTCLALEDSPNGVLSAKAAGMLCLLVPDPHMADDPRMDKADVRLPSLTDFTPDVLDGLMSG